MFPAGATKDTGLRAAPAARPSGHRPRRCLLRHPAYAVPLSREWL